jgi:rhodanese-related sulfurtransferase
MKQAVTTLILAALTLTAPSFIQSAAAQSPKPATAVSTAKKLTRAEFDALLAQPERVLLIDVRRPDELQSIGSFPAFLSIQAGELEKNLKFVPKDRQIVTVSNHASRAARAADLLSRNGFLVAGAVGVQDYEGAGGTIAKIAPPAPRATDTAATSGREQGK